MHNTNFTSTTFSRSIRWIQCLIAAAFALGFAHKVYAQAQLSPESGSENEGPLWSEAPLDDASIDSDASVDPDAKTPRKSNKKGGKVSLAGKLNINTATLEQWILLPGIGEKMAARILASRAEAAFASVEDLQRVRGIGPRFIERNQAHLTLSGTTNLRQLDTENIASSNEATAD